MSEGGPLEDCRTVVISWVRYHGRSVGLARGLGGEALFPPEPFFSMPALSRYPRLALWTYQQVRSIPTLRTVIVMIPPSFLVLLLKILLPRGVRVIGDLHSGAFRGRRWRWMKYLLMRSMRGGLGIVTNPFDAHELKQYGITPIILHDKLTSRIAKPPTPRSTRLKVAFPASYGADEPLIAIFSACELLPDVDFFFTGRMPISLASVMPANACATGFLSDRQFETFLASSDVVLALTTEDHTMQRAGYEAFMAGIPQVTSDFSLLRHFYEDCAVYCDPSSPFSIAAALKEALEDSAEIRERCTRLLAERVAEQQKEYESLRALLEVPLQ